MRATTDMAVFGWKPDSGRLVDLAGINGQIAHLRAVVRPAVNNAMQSRGAGDRALYADEMERLASLESDLKVLRHQKLDAFDSDLDKFNRTFRRVVKERVSAAEYQAIVDETHARVAEINEKKSTAPRGPALEPRSSGGGMRSRK